MRPLIEKFDGPVYDWRILVKRGEHYKRTAYKLFRLCTGWDNTPRRGNRGTGFLNSAPDLYQRWLEMAIGDTDNAPPARTSAGLCNAWNEWAEGATLSRITGTAMPTFRPLERVDAEPELFGRR